MGMVAPQIDFATDVAAGNIAGKYNYDTEDDALRDVLRLSEGMTYKSALSGPKWADG